MDRRRKVELFEQIRREYRFGVGTIRGVAKQFGVHRRIVRQAMASAVPPERKVPMRSQPKLEPVSAFCADASPTNQRHPDCSVPGCICPCHSRRSQATWKLEARGVVPSNNGDDFSPQAESVGLMEKLERLGGNRHSTRVSSR
jgi:hypothetical protein